MIVDLYRDIDRAITQIPQQPDLTLYNFNRDESKWWEIKSDESGIRQAEFTGMQRPNALPFVGYSVLRQRVQSSPKQRRVAAYDVAFVYMGEYDFDKNNFERLQQRAEAALAFLHFELIGECYDYASDEFVIEYRESSGPIPIGGAYMFATYRAPLKFNPCCADPEFSEPQP